MVAEKRLIDIRRELRRELIEDVLKDRYAKDYISINYEDEHTKSWRITYDDSITYDEVVHEIYERDDNRIEERITVSRPVSRAFVTESDSTITWGRKLDRLYRYVQRVEDKVGNMRLFLTVDDVMFHNEWGFEVSGGFVSLNAEISFLDGEVVDVEDFLLFTLNTEFTMVVLDFMDRQHKVLKRLWKLTEELADVYSPKFGVYPED